MNWDLRNRKQLSVGPHGGVDGGRGVRRAWGTRRFLSPAMRANVLAGHGILIAVCLAPLAATAQQRAKAGVTIQVAAISFVPTKFDLPGNADRLEKAFRTAAQRGTQLAVAPEGALDGYGVNEIIAGEVEAEEMRKVAIGLDHPVMRRFQKLADELHMCVVFGFAELVAGDVYNAAVFIDHEGRVRGKYHKMQFAEGYDPTWWFNRLGSSSRAFDTPFGRCGILICNDRWNPALARIPVLDGARFLLIPSYGSRSPAQDEAVLDRGRENNVPIVEANVGVTLIVDGNKIAAVDRQEEGITYGEITIPAGVQVEPELRDGVERQFLNRREPEMRRRLERTRKKKRNPPDQ